MIQARTIEKLKDESREIAREAGTDPEVARKIMVAIEERIKAKRRPIKEPAPEGSITLSDAVRKYEIPLNTISYWVDKKYVTVLKKARNYLYLDEDSLIKFKEKRNRKHNRRSSKIVQ